MAIDRAGNEPWGFIIIGGKDQSLTVKVGCRDLLTLGSYEFFESHRGHFSLKFTILEKICLGNL